eukprot:1950243-Lingulodinium_polyedra.AAC.1
MGRSNLCRSWHHTADSVSRHPTRERPQPTNRGRRCWRAEASRDSPHAARTRGGVSAGRVGSHRGRG